ncbi:uncharacterized protein [Montipora capricornis]|uniref:uncharacterized protein isoform X1 n=1 Tax=Montipora capricornis TaxID=246305 RepID=UPI0035F1F7C0
MELLPATSRLKLQENYEHSPLFKSFILRFVKSLDKGERGAFKFWCKGIVPRSKLDVDVSDDGSVLKLVEFLVDDKLLWCADMSMLKPFLNEIGRADLLLELERVEMFIAVDDILVSYGRMRRVEAGSVDYVSNAEVVRFLCEVRDGNRDMICSVVSQLKQVDNRTDVLTWLESLIRECEHWSSLTVALLLVGELYGLIIGERERRYLEGFGEWMLEHGGLTALKEFIRKKQKGTASGRVALSSIEESIQKTIKSIEHSVDCH